MSGDHPSCPFSGPRGIILTASRGPYGSSRWTIPRSLPTTWWFWEAGRETRPFTAADLSRRGVAFAVLFVEHPQDAVSGALEPDELPRQVLARVATPPHPGFDEASRSEG